MITYKVVYHGGKQKLVSNNQFYSAGHWAIRSALKNKWVGIYTTLCLEAKLKPFNTFELRVLYNCRLDPDNCVAQAKFFLDSIKGKYVKDDSSIYLKGLSIHRDESLPKNTVEFYIDVID